MDKIIIELIADDGRGRVHNDISINGVTKTRLASYIYSILEELMKIDEDACKLAIGAFMLNTAEEEED